MKSKLIMFASALVVSACVFMACQKESKKNVVLQNGVPIGTAYKSVYDKGYTADHIAILQLDLETARHYFISLPPAKKYKIWQEKIEYLKTLEYSQEQKDLMQEVLDEINPSVFNESSANYSNFVANKIQYFQAKGEVAFKTKLEFALIFGTVYDIDSDVERKFVGNGTAPIDVDNCECSIGSDWCDVHNITEQRCRSSRCQEAGLGCGFLFLSTCVGMCSN